MTTDTKLAERTTEALLARNGQLALEVDRLRAIIAADAKIGRANSDVIAELEDEVDRLRTALAQATALTRVPDGHYHLAYGKEILIDGDWIAVTNGHEIVGVLLPEGWALCRVRPQPFDELRACPERREGAGSAGEEMQP